MSPADRIKYVAAQLGDFIFTILDSFKPAFEPNLPWLQETLTTLLICSTLGAISALLINQLRQAGATQVEVRSSPNTSRADLQTPDRSFPSGLQRRTNGAVSRETGSGAGQLSKYIAENPAAQPPHAESDGEAAELDLVERNPTWLAPLVFGFLGAVAGAIWTIPIWPWVACHSFYDISTCLAIRSYWDIIVSSILMAACGIFCNILYEKVRWEHKRWFIHDVVYKFMKEGAKFGYVFIETILPEFIKWITFGCGFYRILMWKPVFTATCAAAIVGFSNFDVVLETWHYLKTHPIALTFTVLFLLKFVKAVVHLISYYGLDSAAKPKAHPLYKRTDVTVLLPSVAEFWNLATTTSSAGPDRKWDRTFTSIANNAPARIIVCTVGDTKLRLLKQYAAWKTTQMGWDEDFIRCIALSKGNKRAQSIEASHHADTDIIAYADDSVTWGPQFLPAVLAEFEDPHVGLVGTVKRVERTKVDDRGRPLSAEDSRLNLFACIYLERHNYECTATYNLDGGVFVISGRTALIRSSIYKNPEFVAGFLNEMFWWGTVGPLAVDDDNYITRYMVKKGWKTVFHNSRDGTVGIRLGDAVLGWKKFHGQILRWARTTWRSNAISLCVDRVCWYRYPWTTYAMFLMSYINIAIIYDPALYITLYQALKTRDQERISQGLDTDGHLKLYMFLFTFLMQASKLCKPFDHFRRDGEWHWFFFTWIFGYYHSLVRLYALFTLRDDAWSGRDMSKINAK